MSASPLYDRVVGLLRANRLAEADAAVGAALDTRGADTEVLRAAAQVAFAAGDDEAALGWLDRAVAAGDATGIARLERAQLFAAAGMQAAAIAALAALVRDAPAFDSWFLLGRLLYDARREHEAADAFEQALGLRPQDARVRRALAESLYAAERYDDALPHFDALAAQAPDDAELALRAIRCVARDGDVPAAFARLAVVRSKFADRPELAVLEGQLHEDAGAMEAARAAYAAARRAAPRWAEPVAAWLMLAHRSPDAALLADAEALVGDASVRDDERAYLHYAIGKAEAAAGRHDRAWAHWSAANTLRRAQSLAEEPAALGARVEALLSRYTGDAVAVMAAAAPRDERPVLVVGMPRSGTTLVEQVLAAHPAAGGAGESPLLPRLHIESEALSGAAWPPSSERTAAMAGRYLSALERRGGVGMRRLVDKQPYNFMFLGLAAGLVPGARVVWCRRDPRDVAVSIFSENFAPHARYATDLGDIRRLIEAQDALMAHWRDTLPFDMLEVRYEEFVADFPAQAQRLVAHAGLPWDDDCLAFHEAAGTVQTNSRWQVRRPVNQSSVGRWRHHRDALAAAGFDVD